MAGGGVQRPDDWTPPEQTQWFETQRGRLRAVAYRMLGSTADADDAVQEAWLRWDRAQTADVRNLEGWLTTVVARICLDQLRSRAMRPRPADPTSLEPVVDPDDPDPADEAALADEVGRAMLVVLDRLGPAERVAWVLHDLFAVPFAEVADVVGRTPDAAKQLASRARRRLAAPHAAGDDEAVADRRVVEAFLRAARAGDLAGLLTVLAPDVARRADAGALPAGVAAQVRGARAVAEETVVIGRRAMDAAPAWVDGAVGAVVVRRGRLRFAMTVVVEQGRITSYDVVADPARLAALPIAVLDGPVHTPGTGTPRKS